MSKSHCQQTASPNGQQKDALVETRDRWVSSSGDMCAPSLEQAHGREVCRFFAKKGWCRYGSSCWYHHGATKTASIESEPKLKQIQEAVQNLQEEHNKKTAIITGLHDKIAELESRSQSAEGQVRKLRSVEGELRERCAVHASASAKYRLALVLLLATLVVTWQLHPNAFCAHHAVAGSQNDSAHRAMHMAESAGSTPSSEPYNKAPSINAPGSAGNTTSCKYYNGAPSVETKVGAGIYAQQTEVIKEEMKKLAKELQQVRATQQRDREWIQSMLLTAERSRGAPYTAHEHKSHELEKEADAPQTEPRPGRQEAAGRLARTFGGIWQMKEEKATAQGNGGAPVQDNSHRGHAFTEAQMNYVVNVGAVADTVSDTVTSAMTKMGMSRSSITESGSAARDGDEERAEGNTHSISSDESADTEPLRGSESGVLTANQIMQTHNQEVNNSTEIDWSSLRGRVWLQLGVETV